MASVGKQHAQGLSADVATLLGGGARHGLERRLTVAGGDHANPVLIARDAFPVGRHALAWRRAGFCGVRCTAFARTAVGGQSTHGRAPSRAGTAGYIAASARNATSGCARHAPRAGTAGYIAASARNATSGRARRAPRAVRLVVAPARARCCPCEK